jgi:hypothetical protein
MNRSWSDLKEHMKSKHGVTDAASYDFGGGRMFVAAGSEKAREDVFLSRKSSDFHYCVLIEAPDRYSFEDAEKQCNDLNHQLGIVPKEKSQNTEVFIPSTRYISNVRKDYRCRIAFDFHFNNEDEARMRCDTMNKAIGRNYFTLTFSSVKINNSANNRTKSNLGGIKSAK